jgi:sugar/nucleoside kinase (ribokinase family)
MDAASSLEPGALARIDSITLTGGGNACNVSLALAKLGMSVATSGVVGDDPLGQIIVDQLTAAKVDVIGIMRDSKTATAATIVAVQRTGERRFFHVPGTLARIDGRAFRSQFDLFRRAAWLQIGYFGLLPNLLDSLPDALAEFRTLAPGTKIALDTVLPPADRELLDPILPHLDLFAPSRAEAIALTDETEPARMVASFRAHMPRGIIGIKLDADGCYLDDGQQAVRVPAYKVDAIDATGAGDAWYAGMLCGLRKGMPLRDCGRLANRLGADCCTAIGGAAGVRNLEQALASM